MTERMRSDIRKIALGMMCVNIMMTLASWSESNVTGVMPKALFMFEVSELVWRYVTALVMVHGLSSLFFVCGRWFPIFGDLAEEVRDDLLEPHAWFTLGLFTLVASMSLSIFGWSGSGMNWLVWVLTLVSFFAMVLVVIRIRISEMDEGETDSSLESGPGSED